jgi:hypothetical protein
MSSATRRDGHTDLAAEARRWLTEVFQLNAAGLHWLRGVVVLDVLMVPMVFYWAIGHEEYLVSSIFGVLFSALIDPGGRYETRAAAVGVFGVVGAGLTALGFALGGAAWGWLVLAAFVVTLAAGLAVKFGVHRFVAALLLNIWFIVAIALAVGFHGNAHLSSNTWTQVGAWAGGSALWIGLTFVVWMIRRRRDLPPFISELPGDTVGRPLTRPVIMFAVLRALVMAGTVALAFGLNLSHGYWMPIAAIVAMKPSLEQTTVLALQRVAGALIGAGAAMVLLLIPANEHGPKLVVITFGLQMVAIVLFMHGAATRFWNYALYYSAISAGVLVLLDLPQPSNYAAEGYRILWTLCGVAIGAVVMFLAGLLARHTAAQPQPAGAKAHQT